MPLTHVLSYQCFGVKWALSRIHFHTHAPTKVLALTGFFHTGPLHTRSATKVLALTGLFHTCPSHTRSATKVLALSGNFHRCTFTHVLSYQGFGVNWALSHMHLHTRAQLPKSWRYVGTFTYAPSHRCSATKVLALSGRLPRFWR